MARVPRKPPPSPYSRFTKQKLELRDYLAIDRTMLSGDRTLLAYIHLALALAALGASAIRFLEQASAEILGWLLIAAGAVVLFVGLWRFRLMRHRMRDVIGPELPTPPEQLTEAPAQKKS
ncbi:MAG: DUF202 domain-containing protein [Phycisphaerae bacterium]